MTSPHLAMAKLAAGMSALWVAVEEAGVGVTGSDVQAIEAATHRLELIRRGVLLGNANGHLKQRNERLEFHGRELLHVYEDQPCPGCEADDGCGCRECSGLGCRTVKDCTCDRCVRLCERLDITPNLSKLQDAPEGTPWEHAKFACRNGHKHDRAWSADTCKAVAP